MARNERTKTLEDKSSIAVGIGNTVQTQMEKARFIENKAKFEEKIQELAVKAADAYQKYGKDDWRTGLLVNFLDMSLQMQDVVQFIEAFDIGNEILFGAMTLMGQSLDISNGRLTNFVVNQKQSPLKQKITMWKAMRNTRNTVKGMIANMKNSMEMAALTTGMYEELSYSMSSMMASMNGKRLKAKKRNEKAKNGEAMSSASGRGMEMISKIISAQGGTPPTAAPTAPAAPAAPAPGGDSGIDDI